MEKEKTKIFCIFFKNNRSYYSKEGGDFLKKIAEIGGTNDYFTSNSLESLIETFNKISDAIQNNYKLKLNE
jgi:hypothetical protein